MDFHQEVASRVDEVTAVIDEFANIFAELVVYLLKGVLTIKFL